MSLLNRKDFLIFLNELQKLLQFCCKFANNHVIADPGSTWLGFFVWFFLGCLFSPCCLKDESILGDYAGSSTFPSCSFQSSTQDKGKTNLILNSVSQDKFHIELNLKKVLSFIFFCYCFGFGVGHTAYGSRHLRIFAI